jgi:hypothetical protein
MSPKDFRSAGRESRMSIQENLAATTMIATVSVMMAGRTWAGGKGGRGRCSQANGVITSWQRARMLSVSARWRALPHRADCCQSRFGMSQIVPTRTCISAGLLGLRCR